MFKSVFSPLISKGSEIAPSGVVPSDRLVTPANGLTLARPVLAGVAAKMLIRGENPVTPLVFAMGISDAEGNLARLIDKLFPKSGMGTSVKGAEWDPIADTSALLLVGGACLIAPRMPLVAKGAVATALGHETFKASWALRKNREYREAGGGQLYIPPTLEGKASMAEKILAVGLATLSSDFDNPVARQTLAAGSLAFAVVGSMRAESQREIYARQADEIIALRLDGQLQ